MKPKQVINRIIQYAGLHYLLARELLECGAAFNPLDPQYHSNPYPRYRRLRERDPVHRSRLADGWVLSRYEDVNAMLRDSRFSADDRKSAGYNTMRSRALAAGAMTEEEAARSPSMLRVDPPDHTRLRSLVNRAFTPRAVEALRPRVEEIVEQLLDAAEPAGRMDVIRDLAYPLPVIVIAEMLGIPPADRDRFKAWSEAVARSVDLVGSPEVERRSREASRELWSYFQAIAAERRSQPREDLLSALLAAEQQGDKLSTDEVFATCELLLVAGNETTTNLIGNGLLALMQNPEQLTMLRQDPALIPNAVEELLRFDSPVQATSRIALEDIEFRGRHFRKGQQAILLLGAANRDPNQFSDPDALDVRRTEVRHMSFGHGMHFCLGSPLARLEAPIALAALLRRFPELRLDGTPEWAGGIVLRGLRAMPVAW